MSTITPTSNGVLVKDIAEDTVRESGLVLPDSSRSDGVFKMEVVATGPGAKFEGKDGILIDPVSVEVGDTVLVNRHAGVEVIEDGAKMRLIRETDILATLS